VPLDTTHVTKYYIEVSGRNILYRYTIDYADKHREALNKVTTIAALDSLFAADKTFIDDFIRYAAKQGVARPTSKELAKSRKVIEAQLKAYIGRNTALSDNAFYYNIFPIDNVVHKALEVIASEPFAANEQADVQAETSAETVATQSVQ
jgi:carboxyl-terminal processing protease